MATKTENGDRLCETCGERVYEFRGHLMHTDSHLKYCDGVGTDKTRVAS